MMSDVICVLFIFIYSGNVELTSGGLAPKLFKKTPVIFKCAYAKNRPGNSRLVERRIVQTVPLIMHTQDGLSAVEWAGQFSWQFRSTHL